MKESDNFFARQDEPSKSLMLAMKEIILRQDKEVSQAWKYGMPFFCYRGKMFCYLWVHKKYQLPYMGIVEGKRFDDPFLIQESRSRMKIMLLDPEEDLPLQDIENILQKALNLYRTGIINT